MERDRLKRLLNQAAQLEKWDDEPYRRAASGLFSSYQLMVDTHNAGKLGREKFEEALRELLRAIDVVIRRLGKQQARSRYEATRQAAQLWIGAFEGYKQAFQHTLEYLSTPESGMDQARVALESANELLCRALVFGPGPSRGAT